MSKSNSGKLNLLLIPLFWGSLWGVAEATLGHLLHNLQIPVLPGTLMLPLGVYFMVRAYISSEKIPVIFLTAVVAASAKLIDFFFPAHSPAVVINPALAILSESLFVMLFFVLKGDGEIYRRLSFRSSRNCHSTL